MLRILLVVVFCLSALYGLKISKPVIIRNANNQIVSVGNLSMRNNTCISKTDNLLVKNIQFHPNGGYIYLITFIDSHEKLLTVSTNFYKLNNSDASQVNNLLDINKLYTVKYYDCKNDVSKYNLEIIYFQPPLA
ncbi:hypothetical protein AI2661V1_5180 (plasmid) [Citrobacter freundii]|nr:hypothetical protein AI2661V1_5180 [Citrobacter freundii]CAH4027815.1 hypothetical protein AI2661V1_5180 [Citrobacter freundii]